MKLESDLDLGDITLNQISDVLLHKLKETGLPYSLAVLTGTAEDGMKYNLRVSLGVTK